MPNEAKPDSDLPSQLVVRTPQLLTPEAASPEAVDGYGIYPEANTLEEIELDLLLEAVYRRCGFDFRNYARPSLRRRVWNAVRLEAVPTITRLTDMILRDNDTLDRLLLQLSVNVTSMFRDPGFYKAFREQVVPLLAAYPFIRVWHAGCATGEEVYSTAIIFEEEGLYDRCRIYATDMNELVLQRAKAGIFPIADMQSYSTNYQLAGGKAAFSDYYTARYEAAIFRQSLRRNVLFSHHNLVTDGSFNEFNIIFCRNVLIYFNTTLQARVHRLLFESLRHFGILCLGSQEALRGTPHEQTYEAIDSREKLYRRIG